MKGAPVIRKSSVELKTKAELALMRKAGELAGRTLKEVASHIGPGITTRQLDRIAESFIRRNGGVPTFIGYRGYPASICASINEEVVHGIPGDRKIKSGDVVSIDVAATVDGFVGDTAGTFLVPPVVPERQRLVEITRRSLEAAIELMRPGHRVGDVSAVVQEIIEREKFGVVRDFVGHGNKGTGLRLEPGVVLAIEPMVTMGSWKVKVLQDGWTVVTEDGSWAAHFEHTVAVTEEGPWILTQVD